MKKMFLQISVIILCAICVKAQTDNYNQSVQIENISQQLVSISRSLDSLNERLKVFSETFSSNQGIRLTEKQQTILIAFEFLNRAEQRLSTLQKLKIELSEKRSSIQLKIADIDDDLRTEKIDRSLGGTTNAEELRNNRRRVLNREKTDLTELLNEVQNSIRDIEFEIRDTEMFLKRIRRSIFPAIDKEISNL